MDIWTAEQEADNLRKHFDGVNRAAFAQENKLKGGPALIYQHITGRRPISLDAAIVYADGFKCSLEEISPRLALEVKAAFSRLSEKIQSTPSPASPSSAPPEVGGVTAHDIAEVVSVLCQTDEMGRRNIKAAVQSARLRISTSTAPDNQFKDGRRRRSESQ